MGELLDNWIQLFDEKNFRKIHDEPKDLQAIIMLFATIQKEFKKVEIVLGNKIKVFKDSMDNKRMDDEDIMKQVNEIIDIPSSPERQSKNPVKKIEETYKNLLKSPVFERHRKSNIKKLKRPARSPNKSNLFPIKNQCFSSTNKENSSKVILPASDEDDDLFNSSIIGGTPNTEISKRIGHTSNLQKKKGRMKTSGSSTLTQMFSGIISKDDEKIDETTMMDIDEILETVEKAETINEPSDESKVSQGNSSTVKKILHDSFLKDYDQLPKRKEESVKKFAYKETVRGNEKKKLKGWSCKECEKFYKGMKLSEEELEKKMDECSKHRSKFKPDDDTIPGYWDLSIPCTPEDQKTQPESPAESQDDFEESTVFCFYKK